jgi:hypothetical protein
MDANKDAVAEIPERLDLSDMFRSAITALSQHQTSAPGETRLFFPNGIEYIHIVVSVGPKDAPVLTAELTVSGTNPKTQTGQHAGAVPGEEQPRGGGDPVGI